MAYLKEKLNVSILMKNVRSNIYIHYFTLYRRNYVFCRFLSQKLIWLLIVYRLTGDMKLSLIGLFFSITLPNTKNYARVKKYVIFI